ncbi:MAG: hypothetical protein GY884_05255 [Proteobacteria bacterium]|nr:hypothetical protein [Pseudomonadota bacterium]
MTPNYGGIYASYSGAEFTATDCDFDADSDIYWSGETHEGLGDDETFFCDDDGCRAEYSTGGYGTAGTNYDTWGMTYLADTDKTIQEFSVYTQAGDSGCSIDYHVLSSTSVPTSSTSWTVEWSSTGNPLLTSAGYHTAEDVDFQVTSGTYYALVFAQDCSTTYYYYDTTSSTTDVGFGDGYGYLYSQNYTSFGSTETLDAHYTTYPSLLAIQVTASID